MIVDIDVDVLLALVESVDSSLEALEETVKWEGSIRSTASLTAARKSSAALAVLVGTWFGEELEGEIGEEEPEQVATDDPTTCGHPRTFPPLPNGQTMCVSCGASKQEDGTWGTL